MSYRPKTASSSQIGELKVNTSDFSISSSGVLQINPAVTPGALRLVSQQVITSSTASVTMAVSSTYNVYRLSIRDIVAQTSGGNLQIALTPCSSYYTVRVGGSGYSTTTGLQIHQGFPSTSSCGSAVDLWVLSANSTQYDKQCLAEGLCINSAGTILTTVYGTNAVTTSAITSMVVTFTTGNISSGIFTLYGLV